ncbi:MAG: glycosyl hydrolase [Candidatus Omnitrophota bacterium]
MEREELIGGFKEPGPEYRSAPFWSWNEKMKPAEVCRQLDLMKQGGYGGGFMHSRVGLITPYLGKEWMKAIKAGIDYAKKNNLLAYLYDEDRWPSGFAGGLTTKKKECQSQILAARKVKKRNTPSANADTPLQKGKWSFKVETAPATEWFNNTPYLNTLKKEAVAEFLRNTYDVYAKEAGKEFGKSVPAIFTDEPNYICCWGGGTKRVETFFLPYTDELPSLFRKEYGYEIEPNYVSLFEKSGNWKKVRHHYWRLVAKLFQENFGRQIYDWCEEHHIALAGHYLAEDNLESQTSVIGAAMPLYEYMQIPGVDHLCNNIRDLLTLKQCSSAAHQLGKNRVLSELYGCSGQNMTFLDRKWIGDWHFALGINLFCPHLWLYSMAGCRKRDYPPTLSYQQPYWLDNKPLEDYFSRTAYLLSRGKFVADILVLHPIESGFMLFEPGKPCRQNKEIWQMNDSFVSLLEELLANHFEFDLGDETLLARHGKSSEERLTVGQMTYRVVVLPEMLTIRRTTFDLLLKFINAGGKVYALKTLPELIEGEKDETALKTLREKIRVVPDITNLLSELEKALPERISVKDGEVEAKNIYLYRKRISDKEEVIFLANTSKKDGCQVTLSLPQAGLLEKCDGFTGKISPVEVEKDGKGIKKSLDLPPGGSSLLMFHPDKEPVWAGIKKTEEILIAESSTRDWQAMPLNPNSLTLDNCAYRLGRQKWQKAIPVIKLQGMLEKNTPSANADTPLQKGNKNKAMPVSLRFTFKTELKEKPKDCYLILERPEQFRITINGKNVKNKDLGFWVDTAFRKIDIKNLLRLEGENVIELKTKFKPPKKPKTLIFREGGTELESIYLMGDFGVKGQFCSVSDGFWAKGFVITSKTGAAPVSLIDNGYPFYAGRLRYSGAIRCSATISGSPANGSRFFLELVKPSAITHRIKINGKEAGLILLPPYRIEVTGLLKEGGNRIEIEAATSLRNLLGPHHHKLGEAPDGVGPGSFLVPEHWSDDYHLVPLGLKGIRIYLGKM